MRKRAYRALALLFTPVPGEVNMIAFDCRDAVLPTVTCDDFSPGSIKSPSPLKSM